MNRTTILAASVILLSACHSNRNGKSSADRDKERPNILLIMTDDVSFDHLSCYSGKLPTPHIENLAREGMLFYQAYATSAACTPSRYSILTGQYAGRSQSPDFREHFPADEPYAIAWNTPLTEGNLTLHEVMHKAGYYTGFVGKFHVGSLDFDKPSVNPDLPYINPDLSPDSREADSLLALYEQVISARVKELTGADFAGAIQWANP